MEPRKRSTTLILGTLTLLLGSVALVGCAVSVDTGDDGAAEVAESTPSPETTSSPETGGEGPLDTVLGPYEAVRQALLEDRLDGVAEAAVSIRDAGKQFMEEPHDGMPAEELSALESLIPGLISAASDLAQAGEIAVARASFWALTESLVSYRKLYANDAVRIAYCPMAEKSWLQPDGKIGNPYFGQFMADCGGFVDGTETREEDSAS